MAPFGSEPAVVEVEPSDHGTDVEGSVHGVELEGRTGDLGTVGDDSAGDDRAQELGALLEPKALEAAAERVEENPSGGVELGDSAVSMAILLFLSRSPPEGDRRCVRSRASTRGRGSSTHSKLRVDGRVGHVVGNVLDLRIVLAGTGSHDGRSGGSGGRRREAGVAAAGGRRSKGCCPGTGQRSGGGGCCAQAASGLVADLLGSCSQTTIDGRHDEGEEEGRELRRRACLVE